MRYVSRILLALFASALASAAFAADNSVILTPGSGVTMRSKDVGLGVEAMMPILADTSGNPLATAPGTSNTVFALPIQGVTGGIAVPISGSVSATLQASATTAIGKVDPNTLASWGLGATGSAVVTNTQQIGGSDGTDLRTLATDSSGHLIIEPGNTANTTAWLVNVGSMGGTAINSGCVSNYGTAPSAVACPSANVFVTNATTNVSNASSGVATGSGNSPTVAYGYAFNGTTWDQLQDDAAKNLKVASIGQANVTATDCSGTVTTGGTAQNAFTAQTALHGFTIANIDTTEPLWISFTTTAAASGTGSYPLAAATATTFANLSSFTAPPGFGLNHALSVIAATTSHKFSCTWW